MDKAKKTLFFQDVKRETISKTAHLRQLYAPLVGVATLRDLPNSNRPVVYRQLTLVYFRTTESSQ
jgi:hypothetical protein